MAFDPDTQINSFIAAEGFTPVDRDYFGSEDWNGQHRFPHYDRERWILHGDNGLSDAEKAILVIDAVDVRYKATSTHIPNAEDWQPPINSEVSTYRSTNTTYFAVPRVPALVFARDGGVGIWFPLMERQPYLSEPPPLEKWLNMLRPTGSRAMLGQYEAVEYAVALSHADQHKGRYLAWTGRIWFIPELPDSAGIQGLPGSSFAGQSVQFADFWETLGWDLNGRGLILRADLTLHDSLTEEQVLLLQGPLDPAHIAESDHDRQTVCMRIENLAANETGVLSDIFPDLAPVSIAQWPYDLPPQTVGILERY